MKKKNSARGIVIKDNNILLIHRIRKKTEYYSIPGGSQEKWETIDETVIREIYEESSIKASIKEKFGVFESDDRYQHIYLCNYIDGEPILNPDSVEAAKMKKDSNNVYIPLWVPISKALTMKIQPNVVEKSVKNFLKQYL